MFFIIPEHKYFNRKNWIKELLSAWRKMGNKHKETAIQSHHKIAKVANK